MVTVGESHHNIPLLLTLQNNFYLHFKGYFTLGKKTKLQVGNELWANGFNEINFPA